MPELLLVNPRRRRKSKAAKSSRRKRRAPARAANPVRKRRSRRRNPIAANPIRRRRRVMRRKNPIRARRRKYSRNPIRVKGLLQRALSQQFMPALTQAGGALGIDIAYGFAQQYLPAQFTAGPLRHATKGVFAVLLSVIASNFVKSSLANDAAKGALTVILHDAGKDMLATIAPSLPLGYYNAGYMGLYSQDTYNPTAMLPQPGIGGLGLYENESSMSYDSL